MFEKDIITPINLNSLELYRASKKKIIKIKKIHRLLNKIKRIINQ